MQRREMGRDRRKRCCDQTRSYLEFHSVNTMFVLGFRFCFESLSTFSMLATRFISLLSISGYE
jgi:hypothetical protein